MDRKIETRSKKPLYMGIGGAALAGGQPMQCPYCGEPELYRTRSHGPWERLLKVLMRRKAYLCSRCGRRFLQSDRNTRHANAAMW